MLETHVFTANVASMKATDRCGYQTVGPIPGRYFRQGKEWEVMLKILTRQRFHQFHSG